MPILVIEHDARNSAGILGRVLVDHGLRLQTARLHRGENIPEDLDDLDGIVSMGGANSATDDALPWLAAETTLLQRAHDRGIPILGICLGAQVLARALGGQVSRCGSPKSGLGRVDLTPAGREDPLFRGLPWFGEWPDWHEDEISEAPPDARILARSEHCSVEAFACGIFSYGIQFHPEWSAEDLAGRCEAESNAAAAATVRDQSEMVGRQAARFAENVAAYLLPVERVNAGIAKDIHH